MTAVIHDNNDHVRNFGSTQVQQVAKKVDANDAEIVRIEWTG